MDLKQLAEATADTFNDRSYRDRAKDMMDPDVLIVDKPTNQEMRGPEAYVQYSDGFVNAIPDLKRARWIDTTDRIDLGNLRLTIVFNHVKALITFRCLR